MDIIIKLRHIIITLVGFIILTPQDSELNYL